MPQMTAGLWLVYRAGDRVVQLRTADSVPTGIE